MGFQFSGCGGYSGLGFRVYGLGVYRVQGLAMRV